MVVRDVIVEDVAPSVEFVPRNTADYTAALQFRLQRCFLVSQLGETVPRAGGGAREGQKEEEAT